jgi:hypothetical protein
MTFLFMRLANGNVSLSPDSRCLEETFVGLIKILDGLRSHPQAQDFDNCSEADIRAVLRDLSAFCEGTSVRNTARTVEGIALNLHELQERLENLSQLIKERKSPSSAPTMNSIKG